MRDYLRTHEGEVRLFVVLAALMLYLRLASSTFFTAGNLASLLNNNAVNVIWAVGLLVVLIAGGIDISFAVGASVAQYLTALALHAVGGVIGFSVSCSREPSELRSAALMHP
jgi:simple sugar transport system permease protein